MAKITVYPTSKNAMAIAHPIDGKMSSAGSAWEQDGFTARMITDGAATIEKHKGFVSKDPMPDYKKPPAHATDTTASKLPIETNTVNVTTRDLPDDSSGKSPTGGPIKPS